MAGPTYATFANTYLSKGFDFTIAPGVTPSICNLYTVPHVQSLPQVGELVLQTYGESPFVFRDCLLENPSLSANRSGQFWNLPIQDRRWKWQWGQMYGWYNKPNPNGTYEREKTPQELASMLFEELGETGFDVTQLPNSPRPEVRWDGAPADAELDNLCQSLGCVVVLNPLSDRAEIWLVGQGNSLPGGYTIGAAYAPVLPAKPSKIRVEAGPTIFQSTFLAETVGMDTDGTWKPINDLSYKPTAGWSGADALGGFLSITDDQTYVSGGRTLLIRDLAAATVFRCYRLTGLLSGGWCPPILQGSGDEYEPQSLADLQLFDVLAEEEISTEDGGLRRLPARVYVRSASVDRRTPAHVESYPGGYSLDNEHGILQFNEPLFLWGASTTGSDPATVHFECAFYAGAYGVFSRRYVEASTGSPVETPTRSVQRPDLQARIIYSFSNDGGNSDQTDNIADLDQRLNYWGNAALAEYQLLQGGTVNYVGLVPVSPDGLTQQITWSGGGGREAITTVSQAQRHRRQIAPLEEIRDRLTVKRQEQLLQQMAFGAMARLIGGGV